MVVVNVSPNFYHSKTTRFSMENWYLQDEYPVYVTSITKSQKVNRLGVERISFLASLGEKSWPRFAVT
jgi:hypothetical protein